MRSYVQMLRIDGLGLAWCECVGGAGDMVDREEEALDELLRRQESLERELHVGITSTCSVGVVTARRPFR